MSFRCDLCGAPQESGSKPTRVVTRKRDRVYPKREKANPKRITYRIKWVGPEWPPFEGRWAAKKHESEEDDPGGSGWEIAEEVNACEACATGRTEQSTHRHASVSVN